MSSATKKSFLNNLIRAEILSQQQVADLQRDLADVDDAKLAARILIDRNVLTDWQARYLLSGKHRLKFGNYVLLRRLQSHDFGDSFVAFQEMLDRYVKLQFLTVDISNRLQSHMPMVRQAAAQADFSHANLEHLHVVEIESDRMMLVSDYCPGRSLDDPELLSHLQLDDLHAISLQLLDGMAHAHKHNLSHGRLTEKLLVYENGCLHVTDLFVSFLLQNLRQCEQRPKNNGLIFELGPDIESICNIGFELANRLERGETEKSPKSVRGVLARLQSGHFSLLGAADAIKHLASYNAASRTTQNSGTQNTSNQPPQAHAQLVHRTNAANERDRLNRDKRKEPAQLPQRRNSWTVKQYAIGLLASLVALVAVYLIGWQWSGRGKHNESKRADNSSNVEQLPDSKLNRSKSDTDDAPQNSIRPARPVKNDRIDESLKSDAKSDAPPAFDLGHGDSQAGDSANGDHAHASSSSSQPRALGKNETNDGVQFEVQAAPSPSDKNIASTPTQIDSRPENPTKEDRSVMDIFESIASKDSDSASESRQQPAVTDDQAEQAASNPNENSIEAQTTESADGDRLPAFVDIPATNDVAPAGLFPIPHDTASISLKLISGPEVSRSPVNFVIHKTSARVWGVGLQTPDTALNQVAEFRADGDQFQFAWAANAADEKNAGYLSNAIVNLKMDDAEHFVQLRRPITLPEFKLAREEGRVRAKLPELEFLPKRPIAELGALDEQLEGPMFLEAGKSDRTFANRDTLILHFNELEEYHLVYLELKAEFGNRPSLEAALKTKLERGRPTVATSESLESMKTKIENVNVALNDDIELLGKSPIAELRQRFNFTQDQFKDGDRDVLVKEMKKELQANQHRLDAFQSIVDRLESLYDRPLPITVYFEMQGRRVVLVESPPAGTTSPSK
jgi:hypothetical protein